MKRAAIWMGVLMMILPLCAASAAEPQVAPPAPGMPAVACGQAASQITPLTVLEREIFTNSEVRPLDMASNCCTLFGCCTPTTSGCESCSGGRRWYQVYSCPGGGTCTVRPNSCPTPC